MPHSVYHDTYAHGTSSDLNCSLVVWLPFACAGILLTTWVTLITSVPIRLRGSLLRNLSKHHCPKSKHSSKPLEIPLEETLDQCNDVTYQLITRRELRLRLRFSNLCAALTIRWSSFPNGGVESPIYTCARASPFVQAGFVQCGLR